MTVAALLALGLSVSLTANDLERSIRFYTSGLGFVMASEWSPTEGLNDVMIKAGLVTFGLSQDDFSKGKDRVKGVGMGLNLVTEQDLALLARRVKAAGIAFETELAPLPWGPMGFTVRDPDGFRVTLANPE